MLYYHAEQNSNTSPALFLLITNALGDYPKAPSTQQQYWAVALLHELESEGMVEQVEEKGPWRLK